MMVPVFFDRQANATRAWVVAGWTNRSLHVSFARAPAHTVYLESGVRTDPQSVLVGQETEQHAISYPVAIEVTVKRVLDRDELRKLCDQHQDLDAIRAALAKLA